jgi:hypothetical protein
VVQAVNFAGSRESASAAVAVPAVQVPPPGDTPPGDTGSPPPADTTTPPVVVPPPVRPPALTIGAVSLSPRTWRPRKGTTLSFRLSRAANVRLDFVQLVKGSKVRGRCVTPSSKTKRAPRCTRARPAGSLTVPGRAGANAVKFTGKLSSKRTLAPGTYTVVLTAADGAARAASKPLTFTTKA